MILVFDLDDTLYEEVTYVRSSFKAVASYLSDKYNLAAEEIFQQLIETLEAQGRGVIFDEILKQNKIHSKAEVQRCLRVYRMNKPEIHLADKARACLEHFASVPKYLVTDGNKVVQTIKINALGLDKYFKRTLPTHNFGLNRAKPSTYVFHKIVKWEKAQPEELVYIGDNPNKDFINLKKEGFKTVRVLTGMFRNLVLSDEHEAHYEISSLDELDTMLLNKILKKEEV